MPEWPICEKCKHPIDEETQSYVVTNKHEDRRYWNYYHVPQCYVAPPAEAPA